MVRNNEKKFLRARGHGFVDANEILDLLNNLERDSVQISAIEAVIKDKNGSKIFGSNVFSFPFEEGDGDEFTKRSFEYYRRHVSRIDLSIKDLLFEIWIFNDNYAN